MGYTSLDVGSFRMPLWRIICCTFAMCGIQVCYAAQINMGTAQLLLLGLSERSVSMAWLAGPLSGLIVQPLIGLASDSCTSSLGRRRPFLLIGTSLTVSALLLFSNSIEVSTLLVSASMVPTFALRIAIFSFFLLDFSIQAVQAPLRALVIDIVPQSQRAIANSYIGVFTGLGNLIGGYLTSLELINIIPFFKTNVQGLFSISAMLLASSVFLCCLFSHEERVYISSLEEENNSLRESSISFTEDDIPGEETSLLNDTGNLTLNQSNPTSIFQALINIPSPFWNVFAVQMCTWCGFFTLFVYLNAWIGTNVYMGDGTAPKGSLALKRFESGVKLGGRGNAMMAILTLFYSVSLPKLISTFGTIPVYTFSQIIEATCLLSAPFIRGSNDAAEPSNALRNSTLLNVSMFGVVWGTTMAIPWTLIGNALDSNEWYAKRIGIFTTLFNASQSFPQLVVAFLAPLILSFFNDDTSVVMFSGGIMALFGALLLNILTLSVPGDTETREQDKKLTSEEIMRMSNKYEDIILPKDFVNIFERAFQDKSDLVTHVSENVAWLR